MFEVFLLLCKRNAHNILQAPDVLKTRVLWLNCFSRPNICFALFFFFIIIMSENETNLSKVLNGDNFLRILHLKSLYNDMIHFI